MNLCVIYVDPYNKNVKYSTVCFIENILFLIFKTTPKLLSMKCVQLLLLKRLCIFITSL